MRRTGAIAGLPRRRWPVFHPVVALAFGLSTMAAMCTLGPGPSPPTSEIVERFSVDHEHGIAAVRRVHWSVDQTGIRFTEVALASLALAPGGSREDLCSGGSGGDVVVIPADRSLVPDVLPAFSCEQARLDLTETCDDACAGSATVLLRRAALHPDDARATVETDLVTILTGGRAIGAGGSLALVADPWPGQDASAAVRTTRVAQAFSVGPEAPTATLHVVLRVPAAALVAPLEGLYGSIRIWARDVDVKSGFGRGRSVSVGELRYAPELRGRASDVDWLRQCVAGVDCEIPITLDVTSPGAPSAAGGAPLRADYYSFDLEATLVALDGRDLPQAALILE